MLVVTARSNSRQATRARSSGWPAAVWTTLRPSSPSFQQRIWKLIRGWRLGTISRIFASSVVTSTWEDTPKPKTEAWYRQFLDRTECPQSRKPDYPLPIPLGWNTAGRVPAEVIRGPLHVFHHGQETTTLFKRRCLIQYIIYVHGQASNLSQARQHFLTDRPGAWALSSILESRICGDLEDQESKQILLCLAHCFVAENDIEALLQWMRVTVHLKFARPQLETACEHRWKSILLMGIIRAQIYWSESPYYAFDATSAILDGIPSDLHLNKSQAISFICTNALVMAGSFKDVDLYERLVSTAAHMFDGRRGLLAHLDLAHPTRPSAHRLLDLYRNERAQMNREERRKRRRFLEPTQPSGWSRLKISVLEAIRVCVAQNKESEARWLLDAAYDHAPLLFTQV